MGEDLRRAAAGHELAARPHDAVTDAPTASRRRALPGRLTRPWRAVPLAGLGLLVTVAVYGALSRGRLNIAGPSVTGAPVIAVLPLVGVNGDAKDESLATGIADTLISSLSRAPGLTVVTRQATLPYRDRGKDAATIARELGATVVIDGSLQRTGEKLRVTLSLLSVDSNKVAWSNSYDGNVSEVLSLQSQAAADLTDVLQVKLSPDQQRSIRRVATPNADAFADYAQAQTFLERPDLTTNLTESIRLFESATTRDPRFVQAWAGRGQAYWRRYLETKDMVWASKARESATEALRLDPNDASVRYSLAVMLRGTGRDESALEELRRAIRLQPDSDRAHSLLGQILLEQGKRDEAFAELKKAIALRPNYWGLHQALGVAYYRTGRYAEAAAAFRRVTELQPDSAWGFQMLGTSYHALGQTQEALVNYQRAIAIAPDSMAYSNLGTVYYEQGHLDEAAKAYEQAIKHDPTSPATRRNLGDIYMRLGNVSGARSAYRKAVQLSEERLRTNPADAMMLATLALCEAKLGAFVAAMDHARQASALTPTSGEVLYREAVVFALAGRTDLSVAALNRAFAQGYSRSLAGKDEDLRQLRHLAGFQQLVEK
jgi:serine/threonine-protein kinase